ncbi:hypothetical protein [Methylocella sp.]|uniref:hypothetical protein n=1 Tax=Methylocella sp. TaxID=1978226 RepID=UPI003783EC48
MIPQFDEKTKSLIGALQPRWTALRMENRRFSGLTGDSFTCASVLFVGQPSLLCGIDSSDFQGISWEYFRIRCDIVDESIYHAGDITLARKGGASELDHKLQWLFERPTLTLTEGTDEFWDSDRPDAKHYEFAYYNGLLISDPKGRGALRLTVINEPYFTMTGDFVFPSELS